eukprot:TRINITY_DN203_c0_g1_i17.p1 TRINITY_DN203_c0_g1~~TRINITY_DN203_c0_g1_i17.p1  ORF type:complete len:212 (-),score=5.64 TRINITY_DN203_c0_g1_i17:351-986(-)
MGCAGAKGRRADPDVPGDSRKQATSKECVAKATSKQPAAMAIVGTREATPSELTDIVTQLRLEFPDDSEVRTAFPGAAADWQHAVDLGGIVPPDGGPWGGHRGPGPIHRPDPASPRAARIGDTHCGPRMSDDLLACASLLREGAPGRRPWPITSCKPCQWAWVTSAWNSAMLPMQRGATEFGLARTTRGRRDVSTLERLCRDPPPCREDKL